MGVLTLVLSIIFVIIFPPAAVMIHDNDICNKRVLICLALTILGWIPGVVYAAIIISTSRTAPGTV